MFESDVSLTLAWWFEFKPAARSRTEGDPGRTASRRGLLLLAQKVTPGTFL
jgi:hypothetical protein